MATQFFTAFCTAPRLINEDLVHSFFSFDSCSSSVRVRFRRTVLGYYLASAVGVLLVAAVLIGFANAQTAEKTAPQDAKHDAQQSGSSQPAETEKNAAQIELLETRYRFAINGDSRKEVHTRVRINNELGVQQFGRLNFDFNRGFQTVEIPLIRITHASGGIADILPGAITDNPNPAVVDAPAYQDVRVKSVRILGLQPGDLLEYRVITTTSHHPLAPDFWLDHTFDRTGIVSQEIFVLQLPLLPSAQVRINPETPPGSIDKPGDVEPRVIYTWDLSAPKPVGADVPDLMVSTFADWGDLSERIGQVLIPFEGRLDIAGTPADLKKRAADYENAQRPDEIVTKAKDLTKSSKTDTGRMMAIYDFVSQKITTVDLQLGSSGFVQRRAAAILSSGYANPEDKYVLLASIAAAANLKTWPVLIGACEKSSLPMPSLFKHVGVITHILNSRILMDPSLEVAPFGVIRPGTGRCGIVPSKIYYESESRSGPWVEIPAVSPFPAVQKVKTEASITTDGGLTAKVHYSMRAQNELLLRVAFHKTPRDKWKDVAQLLAISDGFRGQITNVTASDPYATKEPFTVEYEITQPKFVDWSKKTVRIPALLPMPGLPEAPSAPPSNAGEKSLDLGTPLEIDLDATVTLPEGTTAQAPSGTSVERNYATFSSTYSAQGNTIHATRKLHFILREIPATRAGDLNAFLHAVQADQTQLFTLQRSQPSQK